MWDKQERVLAVIVFTVLYCKVSAVAGKELNMAPNAVDDQYNGCQDKVLEKVVESGLLEEELNRNELFKKAWSANTQCNKEIPGGKKVHMNALQAYANGGNIFRKNFNNAVETMGGNASVYESSFHFKSLHFLLMDSMRLLNKKNCQTVYGSSEGKYTVQKGSEVRFGRFTSVFSDQHEMEEAADLKKGTFFSINSCSVLNLRETTCDQEEDVELLLSPAEVFTVEEVKDIDNDDYSYRKIVLKHSKTPSKHNCYLISRSAGDSIQSLGNIVLMLLSLSLFFF